MPRKNIGRRTQEKLEKIAIDKIAFNEAIQEFMERKWKETTQTVGGYVIKTLALLAFAAVIYAMLWFSGWSRHDILEIPMKQLGTK